MFTLNCNGRLLVIDRPVVMGIINATPDSFYAKSRHQGAEAMLYQAEAMLEAGATLLDIGAQSTRPGSVAVSAEEELARMIDGIEAISLRFPGSFISVDTYYGRVAREAVAAGACLVNDISGGSLDATLLDTVASLSVPYVLMHMRGTPQTMQQSAVYEDVTREVFDFFVQRMDELKQRGIHDIILDPGFGFGKNPAHNFTLFSQFPFFRALNRPLLAGISRKGMIYKTLGTSAAEALNGTTVLNTAALLKGAHILRVHDVREAVEAIRLTAAIY